VVTIEVAVLEVSPLVNFRFFFCYSVTHGRAKNGHDRAGFYWKMKHLLDGS